MKNKENKYGPIIADKMYIRRVVDEMGFCPNYKGYYFLIFMVDQVLKNKIKSFSKDLYPEVAKTFGVNECSIERDIRSLIKVSELKAEIDSIKKSCRAYVNKVAECVVDRLSRFG